MNYEVIEDAPILLPNADHQNFTETDVFLKNGAMVNGKEKYISGLRRGKAFRYRLFITDNKELIHLNKVKPMETTEVTLNAEGNPTPTEVTILSRKSLSKHTVIGTAIGAGAGYYYAKKKGYSTQKTAIVTIVCGLVGFFAGKQLEKNGVFIKQSK